MRTPQNEFRGFTLIELLVVLFIIALLIALIVPGVQQAREAARRCACKNQLKQIGLGLMNYHNTFLRFPIGARSQPVGAGWGPSWWVGHLPFMDQGNLFNRFDTHSPNSGCMALNVNNLQLSQGLVISYMRCPSSPLPETGSQFGNCIAMPSYVGIAGAETGDGFVENRVNSSTGWCCEPSAGGAAISGGGMLITNASIAMRDVVDGASQVLFVGEISDWAIDRAGQKQHIDGGWPYGWPSGCSARGTPPNYGGGRAFNLTTIRYAPNPLEYGMPGVAADHGPSNPLVSAHSSGYHGLMVDGHVKFIAANMDLLVLRQLATRDDGTSVGDF